MPAVDPTIRMLAELRQRAGLTVLDIAARIGWSADSVRNWENGTSTPSVAAVRAYADALGYRLTLVRVPERAGRLP